MQFPKYIYLKYAYLRYLLRDLRKVFISKWMYKYFPTIFLHFKFGISKNINTDNYWSKVYASEESHSTNRFAKLVFPFLTNVDFKNKDVLDVGCGCGTFLAMIKGAKHLYGVDISQSAVSECQNKGIEATQQTLPYLRLNHQYDIVTCFETLEHVKEWKRSLVNIIKHVQKDGYLIISVPNEDSIVISEHVTFFDVERIYSFLKKHVTVLEIKLLGPWVLIIAVNSKFKRGEIPFYFK